MVITGKRLELAICRLFSFLGWDIRMISDYVKYYANKELAAFAK